MRRVTGIVRRMAKRLYRAVQYQRLAGFRMLPVNPDQVLYESFAGNGMLDNPEALFREILRRPELAHLHHVWVLDGQTSHAAARAEFAAHPRVRFVAYRSAAYFRALSTSGYLVNNATFPPEFGKREGQVYLNTWHGTPLKHMGYDMPNGALEAANTLRNFVSADYLLAQNAFMTDAMYGSAYKLQGSYRGLVIEEGYPRVDRQFVDHDEYLATRARLEAAGLEIGTRSIVLYAPTWKGGSFSRPENDVADLAERVQRMQDELGSDRYVVLLKTHQAVARFAVDDPALARILVPNAIPTNVVLSVSNALVTDYSSIFFDFLATGRPIVFYSPPEDEYEEVRGTYFTPQELPGPVLSRLEDVAAAIRGASERGLKDGLGQNYDSWRSRFTGLEDGSASARVVDIVFGGARDGYRLRSLSDNSRPSVLLYLGGMRSNGITTSALNLLSQLDHDRLDVSVLIARPRRGQTSANQRAIHPAVRQFIRIGGMNGDKREHLRRRLAHRNADGRLHIERPEQARLWDDEWTRCFGDTRFDTVIDFSGYSSFWAILLLHSPKARRSIWLHNDMVSEVDRQVHGRFPLRRSLTAIFALYRQFDSLVSVSPSLDAINRTRLAALAEPDAFTFARNIIDAQRVVEGASERILPPETPDLEVADGAASGTPAEGAGPVVPAEPVEPAADVVPPIDWAGILRDDDVHRWFVTVGRLSPEKNQARMLRAFAAAHPVERGLRLLIVGGGALRESLEALIIELDLEGLAFLAGAIPNPFPIVDAADCFVLSSDYEGQPMVLLEAAVLGLPIITVDFGSVRDALPDSSITIVPASDAALAGAMLDFADGLVPPSSIDASGYNRDALEEFTLAIGMTVDSPRA